MKANDNYETRCPYKAGEYPDRPPRQCASCEIARHPPRDKDTAKHLGCTYTSIRKNKSGTSKKRKKKGAPPKRTKKTPTRKPPVTQHRKKPSISRRKKYRDGYDGYYDDVLPIDNGIVRRNVDETIIKKIALLVSGVLLVVGACVAIMYYV